MNKISGKKADFSLMKDEGTRIVLGYGLTKITSKSMYEWYEVYLPKNQYSQVNFQVVKDAILGDINQRTDESILSGLVWNDTKVWLSSENQFNYKAAYDLALQTQGQSLPVTFKIGEDDEENPIYHTFSEMKEFSSFYTTVFAYINQCLNAGWQEKDAIDWSKYEALFPQQQSAETSE